MSEQIIKRLGIWELGMECRPVPNYPKFVATSAGHIVRVIGDKMGRGHACKVMSLFNNSRGNYLRVKMPASEHAPHGRTELVHRLVCGAFHGLSRGLWALHRDDISTNNVPGNLYWGTKKQNGADRVRNGLTVATRGENHFRAVLTEGDVIEVRRLLDDGISQRVIARSMNCSRGAIQRIHVRTAWSWL